MQQVLLVIHVLIAIGLIGVILIQRSEGGGLGIGGGGGGGLVSIRGQANLLTRITAVLAGAFMVTSIVLAIMAGAHRSGSAIVNEVTPPPAQGAPASTAPSGPSVPTTE
ncbi:preprotein translocase subunit SecG [Inquilinus limosus]|uniref:Protein-export membrane protein SecG n=1 Tax=Inquilinus limosus TaxID=171674 RepID=A0A211ZSM7_9PROT|nr:preprotein translocase subunit SecG [Inquilinus limosus]OWJ68260.1 preprotein translocase subunit SecG [Inquilinus limosus]